ncbi:MAG: hypothetical protein KAS39_00025, partial [Actinomycetia bacterium]|nr:hypothetical protein [Actinomycetes bacterium]
RAALQSGFTMIEFDSRLTKDLIPVIIHDSTVKRTTDGKGKVSELTFEEIKKLQLADGGSVPSLEEVFKEFGGKVTLVVEINNRKIGQENERIVYELIKKYDLFDSVIIQSFHPYTVKNMKSFDKRIKTLFIVKEDKLISRLTKKLTGYSCADYIAPKYDIVNKESVAEWRDQGFKIIVWTVNNPAELNRLKDLKVDGIMTDMPDLLIK